MKKTKVGPYEVYFENAEEFHSLKREIWGRHDYWAELANPKPVIIDAGAHIGLSTLYFAYLFPEAQIVALEPNPAVVPILEQNVLMNKLEDRVMVQPVALGLGDEHQVRFYRDSSADKWYSTAGLLDGAWNGRQKSEEIMVPTMRLSTLLNERVDLLKLDIEGVEQAVLQEGKTELKRIEHLFVEFHPRPEQLLVSVVDLLHGEGFATKLFKAGKEVPLKKVHGLVLIEGVRE